MMTSDGRAIGARVTGASPMILRTAGRSGGRATAARLTAVSVTANDGTVADADQNLSVGR
jgi:hypothetical protein